MCKEDRLEKIALLFEDAVEIADVEERRAFMDSACAGDAELLEELERLLKAHYSAGSFMGGNSALGSCTDERDEEEKAASIKPGERLGPYRLVGLIGEGGCSTVYLAEQENPVRRWVALKVIKAGMDTRQIISRFKLERQALAVMDHPGIAKVLDAGATPGGRPFFVMELVRGVEITRHCDEHRLTIAERLELFIEVCHAVLHAHQKGVIHRDIKPENILVCQHDGRPFPKVIDFGIAKVLHHWTLGATPVTLGLPFIGTPAYMSPEQAQATAMDLDTRTDIYSLGALLHELLAGHPPFDHSALTAAGLDEMRRIILTQEPVGPSARFGQLSRGEQDATAFARRTSREELRRAIEGDLEWIVLKAIEKERERRYESAANLAEDLVRHLQQMPVSAAAPTFAYRFSKLMRRNRKAVITMAAVLLLIIVSSIVTGTMAIRAMSSAKLARTLQMAALGAERHSHSALVAMHVSSGLAASQQGNHDMAVLWFASAAKEAGQEHAEYALNIRRAGYWLDHAPIPVGTFQLSSALAVLEFSPDSRYLLAVDKGGNCRVCDCDSQAPLEWSMNIGRVNAAAWHPAGSTLALAVAGRAVQVRNAKNGAVLIEIPGSEDTTAVGFTADGAYLIFGSLTVRAMDLQTGSMLEAEWSHPQSVVGFGNSDRPNIVVSVCLDGQARVLELGNGSGCDLEAVKLPHRYSIRTDSCDNKTNYREDFLEVASLSVPALVAGGNVLATRTGPFEVSMWDLGTGSLLHQFQDLCCSCKFIVSPDGSLLACGLQESRVGLWEVATGRSRGLISSRGACILDIAFGPEGQRLLTAEANGTTRLWSIPEGRASYSTMHHPGEVDKVAFRADGKMVATAQGDGLVRGWVVPGRNPASHALPASQGPKVVRFDPERRNFIASKEPASEAELRQAVVYSAHSRQPIGPTMELDGSLQDAALSSESRMVALALRGADGSGILDFRDPRTGLLRRRVVLPGIPASIAWDLHHERVAAICRSGELIVAAPNSSDFAWLDHGPVSPHRQSNPSVFYTVDSRTMIILTPASSLEVREASTGQLRFPPIRGEREGFWHVAASNDSRKLASTSRDGQVRLWDLLTGACIGSTFSHPGWVYRCRFSPDGTMLVTVCHDGKARVWDLKSGQLSGSPLVHPNEVYDASFTPDGQWVLTACRDGAVRIWVPQTGQLVAPPVSVGAQAFNLEITADGQYAVAGSFADAVHLLALAQLMEQIDCDIDELCLLAETISGCAVEKGIIRKLTTAEWAESFRKLKSSSGTLFRAVHARATCSMPLKVPSSHIAPQAAPLPCPNTGICSPEKCPSAAR
jgi:eukaryotic-like serine/threonine-protein kinase